MFASNYYDAKFYENMNRFNQLAVSSSQLVKKIIKKINDKISRNICAP